MTAGQSGNAAPRSCGPWPDGCSRIVYSGGSHERGAVSLALASALPRIRAVATDVRSLRFESEDEAQRWRVFQAVEDTVRYVAEQQGVEIAGSMNVKHSAGEFHRDTVADARNVVERNGFQAWEMELNIKRIPADERRLVNVLGPWVSAQLLSGTNRVISVSAQGDSEVEVNGVFALVESAVNQARQPSPPPDADYAAAVTAPQRTVPAPTARRDVSESHLRRWLGDVSAQVVAGVLVVVLIAVAGALWAFLN